MAKASGKIRIFSALEVANLCGVVNQTAINWIRSGHLKAFVTPGGQYRVYMEDLRSFMEQRSMRFPPELEKDMKSDVDWSVLAIVDDDKLLNEVIRDSLKSNPYQFTIVQAYDGFAAGAMLAEKRPGFVILDIDLPGIDGNQICRKLKNDPSFGKPFVITITGLGDPTIQDQALAAGADAFMAKPLDLEKLEALIVELAGKVR